MGSHRVARALRTPLLLLAVVLASVASANDFPQPLIGRVVDVTPNNSLIVRFEDGDERQVVFANISIPFGEQPYGDRAHRVLRAQLLNRRVSVRKAAEPRGDADYISALIYVGKHNVNVDLVKRGHAWINPLEAPHPIWTRMQADAQRQGRGLWSTENPTHPIDYNMEAVQRENFESTFSEIAASEVAARFHSTLVGIRSLKVYVPIGCPRWPRFRQMDLIVFTTPASAHAAGYTLRECGDPAWEQD